MKIETFLDLSGLLKLCYEYNVHEVSIDNVTLKLTPVPPTNEVNTPEQFVDPNTGELMSEEDILLWSVANNE